MQRGEGHYKGKLWMLGATEHRLVGGRSSSAGHCRPWGHSIKFFPTGWSPPHECGLAAQRTRGEEMRHGSNRYKSLAPPARAQASLSYPHISNFRFSLSFSPQPDILAIYTSSPLPPPHTHTHTLHPATTLTFAALCSLLEIGDWIPSEHSCLQLSSASCQLSSSGSPGHSLSPLGSAYLPAF